MEEITSRLNELVAKCKNSKLSPLQFESSNAFFKKHASKKTDFVILVWIVVILMLCLVLPFYPTNNRCIVNLPDNVRRALRSPVTCDFCRTVSLVQKVKRISRDEFKRKFAYSAIPVVVTDATTNWTSLMTFDYWYFKQTYEQAKQKQKILNCQFFPYKSGFKNLFEALEKPPEHFDSTNKAWYFGWSNCNAETAEILRQHYGRPYFLPETSENNAVDWIFMGHYGLGAHMHVDNVRLPSWQAQLSGTKKWILMPPPECYFVCSRLEVIVDEGDIIVLDTNKWYHQTIVLPGKISVTIGAEYD